MLGFSTQSLYVNILIVQYFGFESDNNGERVADEAILGLFVSDTDEEDFGGFSTQEEDDDRGLMADFSGIIGWLF